MRLSSFARILTILLIIFFFTESSATDKSRGRLFKTRAERKALRKARNYTLLGQYHKAREQYEILVGIDSTRFAYNYELGMNYYMAYENGEKTIYYLKAALRHSRKDTVGEIFYYLADACQSTNRFDEALYYFARFKGFIMDGRKSDELRNEISKQVKQCELGQALFKQQQQKGINPQTDKRVQNAGPLVNSINAEYAPVVNETDSVLMFTARNPSVTGEKIDGRDAKYFEDMFISFKRDSVFGMPEKFNNNRTYVSLVPNSRRHDAVVSLSLDEKQFITYKDNKLWISQLVDGKWTGPDVLPGTINVGKYQPHATLSNDGKTIYFTSDKPGGLGGLDIYTSVKKENGEWSEPVNMGPSVNSAEDEDSPQISYNGLTLYFSSKGHNSIGGYDIFQSTFDPNSGKWAPALNMGVPLNSGGDDIFYKPNRSGTLAYFSSFRPGGYGDMDIYIYNLGKKPEFKSCPTMADLQRIKWPLSFTIFSKDSFATNEKALFEAGNFSSNAFVPVSYHWKLDTLVIANAEEFQYTFASPGKYEVALSVIAKNKLTEEQGEFCLSKEIEVKDRETTLVITGTLNKDSVKNLDKTNLPQLNLEKVYYGFNAWALDREAQSVLDKNIELLKKYPEIVIKVTGNTDSRGSSDYNKYLSEKRARYVVDYLAKKGISKDRIIAVISGGEENLVNKCADGTDCPNADHALNRRTELTVVGRK